MLISSFSDYEFGASEPVRTHHRPAESRDTIKNHAHGQRGLSTAHTGTRPLTDISVSPAPEPHNPRGDMLTLEHRSVVTSSDAPVIVSDTELREVIQVIITECFDVSTDIGKVAEHWCDVLMNGEPSAPSVVHLTAELGLSDGEVLELIADVRRIGRAVFEAETGLTAAW